MCSYLYRIPQGDISLDELLTAMLSDLSEKELSSAVKVYRHAYGDTISEAEAFEEICCDALGRMNIFEGTDLNSESYGKAQDTVRKYAADKTGSKGRAPPKNGGVKYSVETLSDGKKYVRADRQVIFGNDPASWSEQLENYINSKIRRGQNVQLIAEDGDVLTLTAKTAGKVASRYKDGKTMSDEEYAHKVSAGAHIDELVQVSTRGSKNVPDIDNRHGKMASGGWNYRTAYFLDFDGKYYRCRISIAIGSDGKAVYNIGAMEERSFPTAQKALNGSSANSGALGREASSENVNKKFSREPVSDSAYMEAVERGDTESAQRMVDEAAKKAGYTVKMYHGSKRGGGFTVFRDWSYFTKSKKYAQRYTERGNDKSLYSAYVKIENAFDTRKAADRYLFDEIRQEYGMGEIQDTGLPDWTDGYDIADYIDENGLNYDAIILDEGGDLVDGKPISRGLSYVIRNSNNIKSAEPITYDNNGNVIPLSERFKDNNPDIRYSREPERLNELRRQNERKLAQATAEDAANENERGLIKDYKRQYDKVSGIAEKLSTARQEVLTAERSGGGNTTAKKKIKKTPDTLSGVWQGKKASNPRPTVLETAALPAELFPYKIGGPSGTRTPDRPVMSRLL